jgi:phosphoribosylanthranilate isomerase
MTAVKICGLTRVADARAAVTAGAHALGVVLAPSPRQLTLVQAKRLLAQVPASVLRVGVFSDQELSWVLGVASELALDRVQFHGSENTAYLRRFARPRVVRALRPRPGARLPLADPAPAAAANVVDAWVPGLPGGTGQLSNWAYARALRRFPKTLILSGGLNPSNVAEAIRKVKPDMVDVSSGVEVKPGIKSHAKIRAFIRAAHHAGVRG